MNIIIIIFALRYLTQMAIKDFFIAQFWILRINWFIFSQIIYLFIKDIKLNSRRSQRDVCPWTQCISCNTSNFCINCYVFCIFVSTALHIFSNKPCIWNFFKWELNSSWNLAKCQTSIESFNITFLIDGDTLSVFIVRISFHQFHFVSICKETNIPSNADFI